MELQETSVLSATTALQEALVHNNANKELMAHHQDLELLLIVCYAAMGGIVARLGFQPLLEIVHKATTATQESLQARLLMESVLQAIFVTITTTTFKSLVLWELTIRLPLSLLVTLVQLEATAQGLQLCQ